MRGDNQNLQVKRTGIRLVGPGKPNKAELTVKGNVGDNFSPTFATMIDSCCLRQKTTTNFKVRKTIHTVLSCCHLEEQDEQLQ